MRKNKKPEQVWIYVLLLICVLYGIRVGASPGADIKLYYKSVAQAVGGKAQYAYLGSKERGKGELTYMPFAFLLLQPMGLFPLKVSNLLFYALKIGLIFLGCFMLIKGALESKPYVPHLMGITLLLSWRFFQADLAIGQVNIIILSCCIACLYSMYKGQLPVSAFFLALAVSFKLTPLLFLLYFLYRKKFRFVLYSIGFLLLLNFILPVLFWGFDASLEAYRAWFLSQFALGKCHATRYENFSLLGFLFRYCSPLSWHITGSQLFPVNFCSLSFRRVMMLHALLGALIPALFLIMDAGSGKMRKGKGGSFNSSLADYSFIFIAMLLVSPVSWRHHFVLLFVPHFTAVLFVLQRGAKDNLPVFLLLLLSFVFNTLTASGFVGTYLHSLLAHYGTVTIGSVLLLACISIIKKRNITEF